MYVVCMYVRTYVCMYVRTYVCMYAMGTVPRIGCTTSLESNYHACHARYIHASPPPLWGGLGVVCMYLRRLVGIGMYVCMYVCMYGDGSWGWVSGGGYHWGGVAGRRPGPYMHICIYACIYVYVCMYVRMNLCMFVCMICLYTFFTVPVKYLKFG